MSDEVKKPVPPLLDSDRDRSERTKRSRRHEQRLAGTSGKRIKRSGAARWSKHDKTTDQGDISTPEFHIEHKFTDKKSIGLKKEWLDRVRDGAQRVAKDPMLIVTFDSNAGRTSEDYAVVPMEVFERLLKACGLEK